MALSLAAALALAAHCAPTVAPETLLSVVEVESRFEPLAIGVNGAPPIVVSANSINEAVARAGALIAGGRSVDLGLAQINSRNLSWLGLSLRDVFEPCANLRAAARILKAGYARSDAVRVGEQAAIQTALSYYNTGHPGSITTIHADSATLAFEQLTLLVKESEGGRDLARDDIRSLLHMLVDVVVQLRRVEGRFRMTEVWYDPLRKRALAA